MLSVTLITHKKVFPNTCFNNPSFNIAGIFYGSSIQTIMDNLNQSRGVGNKIDKLYNEYGQEIPIYLWKIQLKENMTFYIDQPNTA